MDFEQALDRLLQPDRVAVYQQVGQERVLGLDVQRLQRVGVGGVAGPGAPGLRHAELVEQHHLELLGRAEVDLLAEHRVRLAGRLVDRGAELRLQGLQVVDVDRDAGLLHPGQRAEQRQLDPVEQAGAVALLDLRVQGVGQVDDRPGPDHRRLGGDLRRRSRRRRSPAPAGRCRSTSGGALDLQLALAGSGWSGRPGRRCAGRAGSGRRRAGCRRSARPDPSRGPRSPAAGPWRRASPCAGRGRRASRPGRSRRRGLSSVTSTYAAPSPAARASALDVAAARSPSGRSRRPRCARRWRARPARPASSPG